MEAENPQPLEGALADGNQGSVMDLSSDGTEVEQQTVTSTELPAVIESVTEVGANPCSRAEILEENIELQVERDGEPFVIVGEESMPEVPDSIKTELGSEEQIESSKESRIEPETPSGSLLIDVPPAEGVSSKEDNPEMTLPKKEKHPQAEEQANEVVIFLAEGTTLEDVMIAESQESGDDQRDEAEESQLFQERMAKKLEELFAKKRLVIDGEEQSEPEAVCPVCQKEFGSLETLKRHVRRHYEEPTHECSLCGKKFWRIGDRKRHERSCQKRPYRCEFCIFCFASKQDWEEHMGRHKSMPGHKCDLCGVTYLHQRTLRQHMRSRHKEHLVQAAQEKAATSMECQHCQETFGDIDSFREHMKNNHKDMEKEFPFQKYQCKYCPQVFTTLRGQRTHLGATHAEEELQAARAKRKTYQCELCGKMMSKKNADYHRRSHTGEKPFKCDTCGKSFASHPNLKEHQRVHTKEKPFKCRYCPMTFTATGSRVRHERKHTGEMPYTCNFCGKQFRSLGGHEVHERSHTKVTPYQCPHCPKKFTYRNVLNIHLRSLHNVIPQTSSLKTVI